MRIHTSLFKYIAAGGALVVLVLLAQPVHAAPPAGFQVDTVTAGLNLPTAVVYTPDGRALIAEKAGVVRVLKNGSLLPAPFITLTDINDYGDRGLLGIELDPDFANNGYVYLLYTYENTPGTNYEGPKTARLVRVTASGDAAAAGSEVALLGTVGGDATNPSCEDFPVGTDCIASDGPSHTIADVHFGPDGKLYVSAGDAASFDVVDPLAHRALDLDSLNGKVLRINPDGTAPADNPFFTGDPTANRSKVWNYGLRNPFRFGFRPANGSLYIGDVGWFSWEEVNLGVAGANFGWPCHEGAAQTPGYDCTSPGATDPLYTYAHDANGAGSVTGGVFYTATSYPAEYADTYFFGDFAQNWIKRLVVDASDNVMSVEDFMDDAGGPVEFSVDPATGDITYLSIYTGELRRIRHTGGNRDPIAVLSAAPTAGLTPLQVTFSSASSSDPDGDPITFLWDFGDGATSSDPNPVHTYTVDGVYTVQLEVRDDKGGVALEQISIHAGNESPTAAISNPPDESLYSPGQIIPLVGTGTDPEDGALPESAYSWRIILHHNVHVHILQTLAGSNPSFIAPDHGDDPDVYIEAELTVTDSVGLTDTASINLRLAPPSTVAPYHVQTTVAPAAPEINTPLTVTTLVGNTGSPDPILIDIELFDSAGNQVAQAFYDNQVIDTNSTATYTLDWMPTAGGSYRVAVGLIHTNWNGLYEWTDNALTFSVIEEWSPESPNGALDFDGIDDYVNTEWWDIEEPQGFTLESRFKADSVSGDTFFIAKAAGTLTPDYDWAFGLREVSPTQAELLFVVKADGVPTELTGGTVSLGEFIHASAVYDNSTMEIFKNGVSVASVPKSGRVSTSTNVVWLGNTPEDAAVGAFDGLFDEIRVWNEPQSAGEIAAFQEELTAKEFGLIKDWRFNEGFGQVVIDSSNSGHHGQLGSASTTDSNDPVFIAGTYSPGGTFVPTHTGTTVTPNPASVGTETSVAATVQNIGDGAGFMIVDIEVYDASGTQVHQEIFDGVGFAPGEAKTITSMWTPAAEGTYRVEVGLVELFWEGVYEWVGDAASVTVGAAAANTAPTITLLGSNPMTLTVGDAFVDPGATASDAEDGDITASIVVGGDTVDTGTPGTYLVTYNVTDSGGLAAPEVVRTVNVVSGGAFTPVHQSTVAVPDPSSVGEEVIITTEITNTGDAGSMLVNLEVYDAGVKSAQEFYDNEAFAAGETRQFTLAFTPTHEGQYGIAIGLFEPGWVGMYEWIGEAATFTTGAAPPPPPPPATSTVVYDDALASGWASWSWDTSVDFAHPTTVFEGTSAIEAAFAAPWAGFYLHHDAFDTTGHASLSLAISGGATGGQGLQLRPYDAANAELPAVSLAGYLPGGSLAPGTWNDITIPLTDLAVAETTFTGFVIQGNTGSIEDTFYIDSIRLE